jgi:thymidylate synthase (FAD)
MITDNYGVEPRAPESKLHLKRADSGDLALNIADIVKENKNNIDKKIAYTVTEYIRKGSYLDHDYDRVLTAANTVRECIEDGCVINHESIQSAIIENAIDTVGVNSRIDFPGGYAMFDGYIGGDVRIAYCAKESYGADRTINKESKLEDVKYMLYYIIKRLTLNGHSSPFEQGSLALKLSMPIFTARQLIRHRTAKLNEISARYTKLGKNFYTPSIERVFKSRNDPPRDKYDRMMELMKSSFDRSYETYEKLIEEGMPFELSRMVLPLSVGTEMYWQMDLNNLKKFFTLRLDKHAQEEIRYLANAVFTLAYKAFPITLGCWFWYNFVPSQIRGTGADSLYGNSPSAGEKLADSKDKENTETK